MVDVIEDLNVSGSDKGLRLDRPGLLRVREMLPDVDVVIFAKLDRLARNVVDFRAFSEEAARHDVALVSVAESLDLTAPSGRFVATILAAFAEMEAATIRARSLEGIAKTVALRRWRGGRPPYGYRIVPHSSGAGRGLELNPDEADVMRDLARRLLEGSTLYRESARLNDEGVAPRMAKEWTVSAVRAMVTGDAALGRMRHRGALLLGKDGMPETVWPPVLTRADSLRLREKYRPKGSSDRAAPTRKASRLLSGIALCNGCGERMRVNSNRQGHRYSCGRRSDGKACPAPASIGARLLEQYVEAEFLRGAGWLPVMRREMVVTDAADAAQADAAVRATAAAMAEPDADMPSLTARLAMLRDLRSELAERPPTRTVQQVPTGLTFSETWAKHDVHGRRALLASVLRAVYVRPGRRGPHGLDPDRLVLDWLSP